MHNLKYLPISCVDTSFLTPLLNEEEAAWMTDLEWDYAPIRRILVSYMNQKLLPGYVAVYDGNATGYIYFLMNSGKGIIGSTYVVNTGPSQEITDKLISLSVSGLKESPRIRRVEAQIMPFNNLNHSEPFIREGFEYVPRSYLRLKLSALSRRSVPAGKLRIIPWNASFLKKASGIILEGYRNQADSKICSDYGTDAGCESYLRSILENPGCGTFVPETSFVAMDEKNGPVAFILGCRISNGFGMIPQIAVHPSHQGRKLGDALITKCLEKFGLLGFRSVALTVTPENRKAYDWYLRLGFKSCKEFGAYIWER